jgi:hypothetical protein
VDRTTIVDAPMIACPGCGLELPSAATEVSPRAGASAACWQLYGELAGYEAQHVALLGRYHQLMVDTYSAQHPVSGGSGIGLAFALIGLHLALDEGWRDGRVRDAHQALAATRGDWPRFEPPPGRGSMTVLDVALAGTPERHAELLRLWAADVWAAWHDQHPAVIQLIDERLPAAERARINRP